LARRPDGFLFSPKEAAERWAAEHDRKVAASPGEFYTKRTYHQAIARAAKRAGVALWHPNQLRHSGATEVRELDSLRTAGDLMGHSSLETSKRYAKRALRQAAEVIRRIG
jgi:integrase